MIKFDQVCTSLSKFERAVTQGVWSSGQCKGLYLGQVVSDKIIAHSVQKITDRLRGDG
jgi:hypothetical protein